MRVSVVCYVGYRTTVYPGKNSESWSVAGVRTRNGALPPPRFRYLSLFHDADQEKLRKSHKAFIPAPNLY